MKRVRVGARASALFVLVLTTTGGAIVGGYGCLPTPDISVLPPYDAGIPSGEGSVLTDSASDVTIPTDTGTSGGDTGPTTDAPIESGPTVGTINGLVVNFTQGNGQGVVSGATVAATAVGNGTVLATATSDGNGLFTLASVPAGAVLLNVTKPTDVANRVAYSSTQLVVSLKGGATVSVTPVLHEGCYQQIATSAATGQPPTVGTTLSTAVCSTPRSPSGTYAALTFGPGAFMKNGTTFAGQVRVEMIPLSYPAQPDPLFLSWGVGLPGPSTVLLPGMGGTDPLGAAELRAVDDGDGTPLVLSPQASVTATLALYRQPTAGEQPLRVLSYDTAGGNWAAAAVAPVSSQVDAGVAGLVLYDVPISQLGWWSVANTLGVGTSCVTGSVHAAGQPVAGVGVRGTGLNYLGQSSAVTDSNGDFCLDVKSTSSLGDDAGAKLQLFGAYAGDAGVFTAPPGELVSVSGLTTGSCATMTNCTPVGAIDLLAASCVSGSVSGDTVGSLDVLLRTTGVSSAELSAGISQDAYVGHVDLPDGGGPFCVPRPPSAGNFFLQDTVTACQTFTTSLTAGDGGATCGGPGCLNVGALPCNAP